MPQGRAARGETAIQGAGKARITISLSKDKVRFIKAHSGQAGVRSVSAFIERLVAEAQARAELRKAGRPHGALLRLLIRARDGRTAGMGKIG